MQQLPTISQYADSIANARGLLRTLEDIDPERDVHGDVKLRAGNNAAVFRVRHRGGELMLKCYIKPSGRIEEICAYLAANPDPLVSLPRLLRKELFVFDAFGKGDYYDVVVSDWLDGITLDTAVRRACRENDTPELERLSGLFDDFATQLLGRDWAHGDLKPENIIVTGDRLMLIDHDAIFIPGREGETTVEIGTPAFQHPLRDENYYCRYIDDYPAGIISASLRALAAQPGLFSKYSRSDALLFIPSEISGGTSEAYREALRLFAVSGDHASYALALKLASPTPGIPDIGVTIGLKYRKGTLPDRIPVMKIEGGKCGYTDCSDNFVIPAVYDEAFEFSEGLAVVKLAGTVQVIDPCGKVVIGAGYDALKPFHEGLSAFCLKGKWGFMDKTGREIIPATFDDARSMRGGVAPVRKGSLWGIVDINGQMVAEPVFERISSFKNGCAEAYINGKYNTIGCDGSIL